MGGSFFELSPLAKCQAGGSRNSSSDADVLAFDLTLELVVFQY
jgi:hypothetical protein